tara:strand:- start:4995 stop:5207 length:213 start_codon:yes stop_codon:yes gene_type:complete
MSEYIKVDQDPNFYKNLETGAVINVDDQAYSNYMRSKRKKEKKNEEIDQLKDELSEIKGLLKTLIENNNK